MIRQQVCDHCGDEKHLIPLAIIYINQRLSEQDWKLIRQYDEQQPFEELIRELAENALEAFSYGVWFGKCSDKIDYWLQHYGVKNRNRQQDAEDYVKDKLAKDNFARFRSYDEKRNTSFTTYISTVIRNLLLDYLRKKKPETETLESLESDDHFSNKTLNDNTAESENRQHLEEIGQWFFATPTMQKNDETIAPSPDIPDAIKLSPKERLFLRAMYKDGMSVEEAGSLPGVNMSKWQAHGYHRRLRKRIKKLLNTMGYENLQSLLYPSQT